MGDITGSNAGVNSLTRFSYNYFLSPFPLTIPVIHHGYAPALMVVTVPDANGMGHGQFRSVIAYASGLPLNQDLIPALK
jgi:hypothetical protein